MANTEKTLKATIKLVDKYTSPVDKAIKKTKTFQKLAKSTNPVVLKAKDLASKVINKAKSTLDKFAKTKVGAQVLKAVDKATKVVTTVTSKLRAFAGKVWSATITVKDNATSILSSIKGKMATLAGGVTIGVAIKKGVEGLGQEQTQKLTINRVLTNSGMSKAAAKKEMESYYTYLEDYANKTPFETKTLAEWGTKSMMISKGDVSLAKQYTDAMANTKAFVGDMRTEYEVAQSFHEASLGNMTTLNNMLGANYETLDEALEGIKKNQGGLVDEMSTTIPGLMSTITGKIGVGLKNITKQFQGPITNALSKIIGKIDELSPKIIDFAGKVAKGFETFSKSETAARLMQIFQTVCETVWNAIGVVIDTVSPIITKIMNFIAEKSPEISNIISVLGVIWQGVWSVAGTILENVWKIVKPILSGIIDLLSGVCTWIEDTMKWWEDLKEKIESNPIVATINQVNKSLSGSGGNGNNTYSGSGGKVGTKNAFGMSRIPYNGYVAELHEGEKVLTKQEANRSNSSANVTIAKLADTIIIREEMDIDRVAKEFSRKLRSEALSYA